MKVLSLFDGIGTGRLSLERAGINVDKYYASEIDKNAITIAKTNYSDIIELGSVLNWRNWDIEWNTIDLLIGGSPCTSFSSAGKQQGFNGESKLFFEYRDILNYLKSINPNIKFLLENVIMKKEWEEVITNEVGVKPILIDSSLLSAQQRKRNYWFNWKIEYPEDKHIELKDILDNKDFCYKATIVGRRINNNGHREDYNKEIPIVQCLEVRKANSNKSNCLTTVEKDNVLSNLSYGRYVDAFGKYKSCYNDSIKNDLIKFTKILKNQNIQFFNGDYKDCLNKLKLNENDFVYLDPPYLISTAAYNDGNRGFKMWMENDEKELLNYLDELNNKNVKWALSNVLENNGFKNDILFDWSQKYIIHHLNYTYNNCNYHRKNKGSNDSDEVLITNY